MSFERKMAVVCFAQTHSSNLLLDKYVLRVLLLWKKGPVIFALKIFYQHISNWVFVSYA